MTDWDKRFLDLADHVAEWSKDPSTKVGCVIVGEGRRVLAMGYNGFPAGIKDLSSRLGDRETKLKLTVHAESNALNNAAFHGVSVRGATAYISKVCCFPCFLSMVNAGIVRVVYRSDPAFEDRWMDGSMKEWAREAQVKLEAR